MKTDAGLWIDHRKAVVVMITNGVEDKKTIPSDVEKHVRFSGGTEKTEAEDSLDRRFANQLSRYYDDVIATIRYAKSVLVFGPGEAKLEIEKRLKKTNFIGRIYRTETAGKMTDAQISEKVRRHVLQYNTSGRGLSRGHEAPVRSSRSGTRYRRLEDRDRTTGSARAMSRRKMS
jgi:hypothetical protein